MRTVISAQKMSRYLLVYGDYIYMKHYSIRNILKSKKKVNFLELFDVLNKEYVVVTFLAILEMAKKNEIKISQKIIT